MDGVFIRKYLTDRGFKNEDINYDSKSNSVTYKGANLLNPDGINADGNSYTSQSNIDNAIKSYDSTQRRNELNTILGNLQNSNNSQPVTPFKPTVQAPTYQPFTYNAASDPSYQAALASAKANAQVASKSAQEELNSRGILNSTITSDRLGQIQQGAYDRVSNEILPQLMQQAYQRYNDQYNRDYQAYTDQTNMEYKNYQDQYNQGQDKYKNLESLIPLISNMDQNAFNNDRLTSLDARQKQQDHLDLANYLSELYGVRVDPKDDPALAYSQVAGLKPISEQEREAKNKQTGIENTRADKELNARLANMSADNIRAIAAANRSAGNDSQARLFDIWDRTGEAPEGIQGVPAGTRINKGTTPSGSTFNLDDYKGYINNKFYEDVPVNPNQPLGDKKKVFNSDGARRYILGLNIPPEQIVQLLQLHQLPLTTK